MLHDILGLNLVKLIISNTNAVSSDVLKDVFAVCHCS